MHTRSEQQVKTPTAKTFLIIAVLGSLWGLSEVFLSGAIRMTTLPFRAGILTGVGIGLIGVAVGAFRRPGILLLIPGLAVLCKLLVVPILRVSVMCEANSCLAVMLEGSAIAGVVALAGQGLHRGPWKRAAAGASAALLAASVFYFAGMNLAPCNYLLSFNRPLGLLAFLGSEGLAWAAASALLFPVGYGFGTKLRDRLLVQQQKPVFFYVTSSAIVLTSWILCAVAIAFGF